LTLARRAAQGDGVGDLSPKAQADVSLPAPATSEGGRVALSSRLGWAFLGLTPALVILTAFLLTPNASGHGTHMQLGLPPCGFLLITGYPCPGCGLTTCFAHMVRLEVVEAAASNSFGVLLFLVSFFTIPVSLWGFVRGLPVLPTLERLKFEKWALLLAVTSVAVWLTRVSTIFFRT
jgi:hypothetical protein